MESDINWQCIYCGDIVMGGKDGLTEHLANLSLQPCRKVPTDIHSSIRENVMQKKTVGYSCEMSEEEGRRHSTSSAGPSKPRYLHQNSLGDGMDRAKIKQKKKADYSCEMSKEEVQRRRQMALSEGEGRRHSTSSAGPSKPRYFHQGTKRGSAQEYEFRGKRGSDSDTFTTKKKGVKKLFPWKKICRAISKFFLNATPENSASRDNDHFCHPGTQAPYNRKDKKVEIFREYTDSDSHEHDTVSHYGQRYDHGRHYDHVPHYDHGHNSGTQAPCKRKDEKVEISSDLGCHEHDNVSHYDQRYDHGRHYDNVSLNDHGHHSGTQAPCKGKDKKVETSSEDTDSDSHEHDNVSHYGQMYGSSNIDDGSLPHCDHIPDCSSDGDGVAYHPQYPFPPIQTQSHFPLEYVPHCDHISVSSSDGDGVAYHPQYHFLPIQTQSHNPFPFEYGFQFIN